MSGPNSLCSNLVECIMTGAGPKPLLDDKDEMDRFFRKLSQSSHQQKLLRAGGFGDQLKVIHGQDDVTHFFDKDMQGAFLQQGNNFCFHMTTEHEQINGVINWPGLDDIAGGRIFHTPRRPLTHHTGQFVPFNQETVIHRLGQDRQRLNQAVANYGGLCDILCNDIIMQDLIATRQMVQPDAQASNQVQNQNQFDHFKKAEAIDRLENDVSRLHILKQVSIFQLIKAVVFNKIPNNILSSKDQKSLTKLDNKSPDDVKEALNRAVDNLPQGKTIKFMVYSKKGLSFSGHTMLVRKNNNGSFTLFDPNEGAKVYNSQEDMVNSLHDKQKQYQKEFKFNNVCFVDPEKMLPKKEAKADVKADANIGITLPKGAKKF